MFGVVDGQEKELYGTVRYGTEAINMCITYQILAYLKQSEKTLINTAKYESSIYINKNNQLSRCLRQQLRKNILIPEMGAHCALI